MARKTSEQTPDQAKNSSHSGPRTSPKKGPTRRRSTAALETVSSEKRGKPESQDRDPAANDKLLNAIAQSNGLNHPVTAQNKRLNNNGAGAFGFANVLALAEEQFEDSNSQIPNDLPMEQGLKPQDYFELESNN